MATFMIIGAVSFLAIWMARKNTDYSPGSKNWNHSIDGTVDNLRLEMKAMEYMHNSLSTANTRIESLERDLERMNGIINLYKEFANSHKREHANYTWTEQIPR